MAKRESKRKPREEVPPGATKAASDRDERPGGIRHTPLDDRHGAGTPAGGTEVGGMAGTPIDEGAPTNADLSAAGATGAEDADRRDEENQGYAGHAGGAVGGTPAGGRASGGNVQGGIRPGGDRPVESTVGSKPR